MSNKKEEKTAKKMTSTEAVQAVRDEFPKNKGGQYRVDADGKATCVRKPSEAPKARKEHESKSNV